jgi:quercetin dioxygenase-like cupin family protein
MALKHATSGEVLELLPATPTAVQISQALVCAPRLEVMRLVMEAGKQIPAHAVAGPLTIQCLRGSVEVLADGVWQTLQEHQLMYVAEGVEHALHSKVEAIVLVTLVRLPHSD